MNDDEQRSPARVAGPAGPDRADVDWQSTFRAVTRMTTDPHASVDFFDPFGGGPAPAGRMRTMVRRLDGMTGTIEAAVTLIAEAVGLAEGKGEGVDVYDPGWFPDADFGVIAITGRSAKPWGIVKFRWARRPPGRPFQEPTFPHVLGPR